MKRQRRVFTPDGCGGTVDSWQDAGAFWAAVEPMSGGESFRSDQIQDTATHVVTFRGPNGTRARDRLLFDGRVFNVTVVSDIESRGSKMVANCIEGIAT